jgi:hypothetical protein
MGFEVVVRPAVFPNIRPASPRVLVPADDPTQGVAVLTGGGGKFVGVSLSWSASFSKSGPQQETRRQFDKQKVYQTDEHGNIDRSNFIEIERLKKVRIETDAGPVKIIYDDPPVAENVETTEADVVRDAVR